MWMVERCQIKAPAGQGGVGCLYGRGGRMHKRNTGISESDVPKT